MKLKWAKGIQPGPQGTRSLDEKPKQSRSSTDLLPLITKHVEQNSIIRADMWRGYNKLQSLSYEHQRASSLTQHLEKMRKIQKTTSSDKFYENVDRHLANKTSVVVHIRIDKQNERVVRLFELLLINAFGK
ncbi:hypothetical protein M3Y96_01167900 [Aphelenchoides besseyi]|nr:hypothetical protein M3Y96_01167900 [Aphelenchoides besseyi]